MWKPPVNFLTLHCASDQSANERSVLIFYIRYLAVLTRTARCMDHLPRDPQHRHHLSLWESESGRRLLFRRKCVYGVGTQYVRLVTMKPNPNPNQRTHK